MVTVTKKIVRGKRCENHKTRMAVVRLTSNPRSLVDGTHLCLECVEVLNKHYVDVMKPELDKISEEKRLMLDKLTKEAEEKANKLAEETKTDIEFNSTDVSLEALNELTLEQLQSFSNEIPGFDIALNKEEMIKLIINFSNEVNVELGEKFSIDEKPPVVHTGKPGTTGGEKAPIIEEEKKGSDLAPF